MGLLAALRAFDRNEFEPWKAKWRAIAKALEAGLRSLEGLSVQVIEDSYRPGIPGILLSNRTKDPRFARSLATYLRDHDPPIFCDQGAMDDGLLKVVTICLQLQHVETIVGAVRSFVQTHGST